MRFVNQPLQTELPQPGDVEFLAQYGKDSISVCIGYLAYLDPATMVGTWFDDVLGQWLYYNKQFQEEVVPSDWVIVPKYDSYDMSSAIGAFLAGYTSRFTRNS